MPKKQQSVKKKVAKIVDPYEDIAEKKGKRSPEKQQSAKKKVAEKVRESDPLAIAEPIEGEVKIKEEPTEPEKPYKKVKGGFRCRVCHQKYSHRYKVNAHIKMKHCPPKQFSCEECGKSFKSKYLYNVHSTQHLENSVDFLHCCDKCDYRAKNKHYLKAHMIRKHTDEAKFECDHCGKRFKMKMDLKFHLGTHNEMQHMCDACGRMYTSRESLLKHRRVVHVNEYKYQCGVCHQKLLTRENFESHMKNHQQQYSCDECDLTFIKKYYLTRHKKRVHQVQKTRVCSVCGKAFMCMATMRVHYLTHAKLKPYLCNVCGYSFTQRSSMMLHWKRKHPHETVPPPPVILTNFFDSLETKVNEHVQNGEGRLTARSDLPNLSDE